MGVERVGKEKTTREPDSRIGKVHSPKKPGLHDERVIPPVEKTVVEGKEPGNQALNRARQTEG